jgi:hypothetical protein
VTLLALALLACADEVAVEPLKEAPPAELSEAVRKELGGEGLRILKNKQPSLDLWLRKSLPAEAAQSQLLVNFDTLRDGMLVGAVRVHGQGSDFRAQKLPPGLYTLRYGIQPEDGDHQGTADSRDFLLLSAAAGDASPDPVKRDDLLKQSAKVVGKKHPAVLWLVKRDPGGKVPGIVRDEEHDRWLLECQLTSKDGKPIRLWIVVVGKAADH